MGLAPADRGRFFDQVTKLKVNDQPMWIGGPDAYAAPLMPGDMVMYLFDNCQYGGHTVTVVGDLGSSFAHVSGNTGDAIGVGIGEAKRLTEPPRSKGVGSFVLGNCNKVAGDQERKASTAYIATFDFAGAKLVYSVIRFGAMLAELGDFPNLDAAAQQALTDKYRLLRVRPA
jgi:hypothetical protein